jgi:hypothetical protein
MTVTAAATPVLTSQGQLECDLCPARSDHTIVVGHATLTPRQQLRQAAGRAGWKQTSAGLDVCPDCADGAAAILVPGWTVFWTPEKAAVPLVSPDLAAAAVVLAALLDPEATVIMAAVEDAA